MIFHTTKNKAKKDHVTVVGSLVKMLNLESKLGISTASSTQQNLLYRSYYKGEAMRIETKIPLTRDLGKITSGECGGRTNIME